MKKIICLMLAFVFAVSLGACLGEEPQGSDPESSAAPESPSESDETTWLTPETSDLGLDSETIDAITSILTSGDAVTSEDQSEQSGILTDIDTQTDTEEITSEITSEITTESKDSVITTTPEVTTIPPVVTTDPPVVTTKPVETTEPPVVTTEKPPFIIPGPPETTIPDITMPVVEPENDVIFVVKDASEYDRHVPSWDGKTLTFWDGRTATAPEDGKLIIKDQSGKILNYYIARGKDYYSEGEKNNFGIQGVKQSSSQIKIYFNSSEDFEKFRPTWDGKTVRFNDDYSFSVGGGVSAIIIINNKGQTFASYRQDRYIIDEVPYYVGNYTLDGATHIIISDPKYLYDEYGNIIVSCQKSTNSIIVKFADYPTAKYYALDNAVCICDLDGNVYYSYNMINPVDKHAVPDFVKEKYEEAVK